MVSTGTGKTGKPGQMGKIFPVRENLGNFEQTGKVREFYRKYWKSVDILDSFLIGVYLKNRFLYLLNSSNKTMVAFDCNLF